MADLNEFLDTPGLDTSAMRNVTEGKNLLFPNPVHPSLPSTPTDNYALEIGTWQTRTTPDWFPMSGNMFFAPAEDGILTRLSISDPVAQHNATLVMQALRAFPRMMLRKPTFPPFIHSYCHLYPLPEALANCMSIAHIFVSPSAETRPFLWQSIKREQQRFLDEASTWSNETWRTCLLTGIQR